MNGAEFQEGDLVEAVKGETVIRGRVVLGTGTTRSYKYIGEAGAIEQLYLAEGWTVTVIEKAKPKLPEEPGCYIDSFGAIWRLTQEGRWHVAKQRAELLEPWEAEMLIEDPVRLEPVAETAWRVLDRVRLTYSTDDPTYWANLDKVAAHFGVTS